MRARCGWRGSARPARTNTSTLSQVDLGEVVRCPDALVHNRWRRRVGEAVRMAKLVECNELEKVGPHRVDDADAVVVTTSLAPVVEAEDVRAAEALGDLLPLRSAVWNAVDAVGIVVVRRFLIGQTELLDGDLVPSC